MNKTKRKINRNKRKPYRLQKVNNYTVINKPGFTTIAPHCLISFKYNEVVQYSNATNVGSQNLFNLNSCFDPNRTGVGHQPYNWDQFGGVLYNRYRVLKVKWKVSFGPANSTVYGAAGPVNGLPTTVSNVTTFESFCEIPWIRSGMIGATGFAFVLKGKVSLNELNGVTIDEYLADDRFSSTYNSTPFEVMVLNVATFNNNGSSVTTNVLVELIYEVDLHDPIISSGSLKKEKFGKSEELLLNRLDEKNLEIKMLRDKIDYYVLKSDILNK